MSVPMPRQMNMSGRLAASIDGLREELRETESRILVAERAADIGRNPDFASLKSVVDAKIEQIEEALLAETDAARIWGLHYARRFIVECLALPVHDESALDKLRAKAVRLEQEIGNLSPKGQ